MPMSQAVMNSSFFKVEIL